MKKLIILIIIAFISIDVIGQEYVVPKRNIILSSMNLYCCGRYKIGTDDYYHYESYSPSRRMKTEEYTGTSMGNERFFCFSKDAKRYYFYTDNIIGFYNPTENEREKELRRSMKDCNVRNLDLDEIPSILDEVRMKMDEIYNRKNDSIREIKKMEREKQIYDSIAAAQKKSAEMDEYRKTHNWRNLEIPNNNCLLHCKFCDSFHRLDKYYVIALSSDTIYYFQERPDINMVGVTYSNIHYSKLTANFKNDKNFKEYVETWKDSIATNNRFSNGDAAIFNLINYNEFLEKVRRVAPNGFIQNWGWNLNSADGIEPYFSYYNTSKKTIKYVDFYFSVYNAVGDRCYLKYDRSYVGKVRGVGPVESFEVGSWSWDRATHYTSGDASEMRIIKLIITYMDGTVKTIPKDAILYDSN